jgi:hypothetical protein
MAETIQLITSSEQSTRLTLAQKETEILNLNQVAEEKEKIIKSQLEHFKILEQQVISLIHALMSEIFFDNIVNAYFYMRHLQYTLNTFLYSALNIFSLLVIF